MSKQEFIQLVAAMKAVYARPTFIADESAITVWYALLKDLDYKQVSLNLQYFMQTETREPMPADLRRNITNTASALSEAEAWSMVYKAICKSNYHAKEEFEKLPATVQKAVGSYEQLKLWAADSEFNEGVISSNFKRAYRTACERNDKNEAVSDNLQSRLQELSEYLKIGVLEE